MIHFYFTLYMKHFTNELLIDLNITINEINKNNENAITASTLIIEKIEEKIKILYEWLEKHIFNSKEDEVQFFKEIKPKFISKLIYYSKIIDIESNIPAPKKLKKKYIEKQLKKIAKYPEKNKSFHQYYRSGSKHYDHIYFTRNRDKNLGYYEYHIINYDIRLSTFYDYSVAQFMANDLIVMYLEGKLEQINFHSNINHTTSKTSLIWTASKVDLVELVYALHHSKIINGGNSDVKELASFLGKVFNVEIEENIYRAYQDIKSRKLVKTKFLNSITDSLNQKIYEEDF